MAISVEDARALLRAEVAASSLAAVAERVGIDRSTLRTFTKPDGVQKPIGRVLEPILAYAERRLGSARVGEFTPPSQDGGIVPVPATTLAYWRGRFDTLAEWAHALDAMMQQQREQFTRFTQGVTDFRESGVLPRPAPTRTREVLQPDPAHVAEAQAAIRADVEAGGAARRPGVAKGG